MKSIVAALRAALLALLLPAAFAGAAGHARRCNPKDDVCHDCERICSTRRGDKTLTLNTACKTECEVALYNCDEGNPTSKEALAECVEEALHAIIEEHGDLSTKLIYDVPPSFKELDELKQEDGCIRKEDVKVLVDILDGSSEEGVTMPTAKADVWAMWAKADTNKDGCVDQSEFAAASMGPEFEKDMPVPHHETVDEAAAKSIKSAGKAATDAVEGGAKSGANSVAEDSPVHIPYSEDGSDAAPAEEASAEEEESGDGVMEDAAAAGEETMEDAAESSPVEIPYMDGDEEAAPAEAAPAEAAPAQQAPAEAAPAEAAPAEPEESGDGVMEDAAAAGDEAMGDAAEASPVAIPYMDEGEEAAPAEAAPAEAAPAEAAPAEAAPAEAAPVEEDAGAAGDGIMEDMFEDSPVAIPYAEAQQTALHRPHRSAPQRRFRSFRRAL